LHWELNSYSDLSRKTFNGGECVRSSYRLQKLTSWRKDKFLHFKELFYQTIGKIFFLFLQKYLNREFILEIPRVALKYKESNINDPISLTLFMFVHCPSSFPLYPRLQPCRNAPAQFQHILVYKFNLTNSPNYLPYIFFPLFWWPFITSNGSSCHLSV
jgi:hypothetical protein